jgi:glycosyltransferase involved in cell wall biosynthesis
VNILKEEPILTIVVPCYNEEEVFPDTVFQLTNMLKSLIQEQLISESSNLLFVDDGSCDKTWDLIHDAYSKTPLIRGIKLACNAGHQNALFAGLLAAKDYADCVISIDADLQDDIEVIREFVKKYREGYDVVFGVRDSRDTDNFFKRNTACAFYAFMRKLGVNLVPHHADFRLMSKRSLIELARYEETNLFLRGIVPTLGFPSTQVFYDRLKRTAGESKYPIKKMLALAMDGITSFSIAPIRLVTMLGFLTIFFSISLSLYAIFIKIFDKPSSGWSSTIILISFFGGIQLLSIGIIGEYIGKIYNETKKRPRYIVETALVPLNNVME